MRIIFLSGQKRFLIPLKISFFAGVNEIIMLQVPLIRENKERILEGLKKRNFQNAEDQIRKILEKDDERKSTQTTLDSLLNQSKTMAKTIGQLMKEGKKAEAEEAKKKTQELKISVKELTEKLAEAEGSLKEMLYEVPNIPNEKVPFGSGETDNEIMEEAGEIPELPKSAKPHWELIKNYDIIDFELGNKITGAGFPVYKGKGARLQRAMINFFLDQAREAGYTEIQPPIFINQESGIGTGQLPDKEGQMYHIASDNLYAIPTAEVPITNIYRGEILGNTQIPVKNVGYTPCFRREAGTWGANVRGLNRLHQFDKVEIVQITYPENSYDTLNDMCSHVKSLLIKLGLPFRILNLCGGDIGFTSAQTYDFEVYSAAQKRWLEVSSVSNFESYQANRLQLRYKDETGKTKLLHTLNGSALALPRILAAILENNQKDGYIEIPDVLIPYCGFDKI